MMGPYTTTFPNEIGHGTTLGRSFRRLRILAKIWWGLGCQIYHSFPAWVRLYTHFPKNHWKNTKFNIPANFEKKHGCFPNNTKTKMTTMPRPIDLKPPRTSFYWKINSNKGIGKNSGFHHASLFLTLHYNVIVGRGCTGYWILEPQRADAPAS